MNFYHPSLVQTERHQNLFVCSLFMFRMPAGRCSGTVVFSVVRTSPYVSPQCYPGAHSLRALIVAINRPLGRMMRRTPPRGIKPCRQIRGMRHMDMDVWHVLPRMSPIVDSNVVVNRVERLNRSGLWLAPSVATVHQLPSTVFNITNEPT